MIEFIVTSSVLIVVIIALRYLFRWKISRRLQYALWGLVLLRLLMPFSLFGSQFSIMNVFDTTGISETASDIQLTSDIMSNTEMTPDEAQATGNGAFHESQKGSAENGDSKLRSDIFTDLIDVVHGRILGVVWLVGSFTAGLWLLGSNLMFYRKLRKTRKIFCTSDCRLPVYTAEGLASPCLFGIILPAIYLTPKAAEDADSTRFVLAHEQCHYRHGDHIWSILRGLCLAVWWWSPLVWVAGMLSRTDSEMACDEAVIRQLGEDSRLIYGRTLIDMIAVKREHTSLMCAATAMSSGKRSMKLRLNMIIKKPKTFIPALVALILIVAASTGCTFTGAKDSPASSKGNGDVSAYAQELYDSRNPYLGDASADGALLNALGVSDILGSHTLELDTQKEPYVLRVIFSDEMTGMLDRVMNAKAILLLALIDNVSEIQWRYTHIDKSVGGRGVFTGALTKEDATAALNGKDIKSYGKSAADVQALLDWLDSGNDAVIDYTLIKLGKNGDVLTGISQLSGDDIKLAEDIIFSFLVKSAAWNDVDIKSLDECYLLGARHSDGTSTDYYAFEKDGYAFLQMGLNGQYSSIDDGLYEKLVKRANSTSAADIPGVTGIVAEKTDRTNLEACISDAILRANVNNYQGGDFAAEAHTSLGFEERVNTTTVYAMALYMVFGYAGSGFSETGGSHMPVAMTFEKNDAGEYVLKEYWTPKDGSGYGPSIREKFPSGMYEDALDTQKYILGHTRNCYAQAIEYGNVPVAGHLKKLIETICSSPAESSRPGDYIDAHPIEYREMMYFGRYTLDYCIDQFEQGGQTGLAGHIMASACRDILGETAIVDVPVANGQDWYDAFKKSSQP